MAILQPNQPLNDLSYVGWHKSEHGTDTGEVDVAIPLTSLKRRAFGPYDRGSRVAATGWLPRSVHVQSRWARLVTTFGTARNGRVFADEPIDLPPEIPSITQPREGEARRGQSRQGQQDPAGFAREEAPDPPKDTGKGGGKHEK